MKTVAVIAAMAAAVATVSAGNAIIVNHCEFETYLWAVDTERDPQSPTIIAPGSSYSEPYHNPSTGGVSLKVSTNNNINIITQFEYTLSNDMPLVFYDGSNINCMDSNCPFWNWNLYIEGSDASCPGRPCASQTRCTGFYEDPNDNAATLSCAPSADTILHLCLPASQLPASGGSVSIAAEQPAPSPTPAPSPSPKPVLNEAPIASHGQKRDAHLHAHARRHMHQHHAA